MYRGAIMSEARDLLSDHYLMLAFLTSFGVIQLAAARGRLRGLAATKTVRGARVLGTLTITAGVALYYLLPLGVEGPWATAANPSGNAVWGIVGWGDLAAAHNVNDIHGGLSGNTQALLLLTACFAALSVSIAIASIRRAPKDEPLAATSALEALQLATVDEAVVVNRILFETEAREAARSRSVERRSA